MTDIKCALLFRDSKYSECLARRLVSHGIRTLAFSDRLELLRAIPLVKADAVVADFDAEYPEDFLLLRKLEDSVIALPTILVTTQQTSRGHRQAYQFGTIDILHREMPIATLIDSICTSQRQIRVLREVAKNKLNAQKRLQQLNRREARIARLIGQGTSLNALAEQLQITRQTASQHRARIFRKLGVESAVGVYVLLSNSERRLHGP